jgi:hypothetical protein
MSSFSNVGGKISFVAFVTLAALAGCAASGDDGDANIEYLASTPGDGGADGAVELLPPSNPSKPDAAKDDDDGDDPGGPADAGTDASPDAGGGGGGGTGACAATSNCQGAHDLGTVSGDTGTGQKTFQGSGSQWLKIKVTEDESSLVGTPLWLKATLTSPSGVNFDLHLYVPSSGPDVRACSGAPTKSSTTAGAETASVEFGEGGGLSNGSSDTRTVTVEVRHVSGTCSPSDKWTLK